MAQTLKLIRKKDEITALNGTVIDALDSNSTVDAPSIRVVNDIDTRVGVLETSGVAVGDTLPIGSEVLIDQGATIPAGWEVVDEAPSIYNPNLLINGDFRKPVNQRGKTTYTSTAGDLTRIFAIDRWNMQNGMICNINDSSITLKGSANPLGVCMFSQVLEYCPKGNYTLQVKVLSSSNGSEISISNTSSQVIATQALSVGLNTITVTDTDVFIVTLNLGPTSEVEFEYIKLEYGEAATPFVPRLFAEEIDLCKRYFQRVSSYRFPMVMTTTSIMSGAIPFEKTMRVAPTVTVVDCTYLDYGKGTYVVPASVSADTTYTTNQVAVIQANKNSSSTLAAGMCVNGTIHVEFNAEIY